MSVAGRCPAAARHHVPMHVNAPSPRTSAASPSRLRRATALAAVGAAVVLGGCGSSDPAPTPAATSAPASATASATTGALDENGRLACNRVDEAARLNGTDVVTRAQRTRLLLQAADAARSSSVPQIRDFTTLVSGLASGQGQQPLDQVRSVCLGLGWTPA